MLSNADQILQSNIITILQDMKKAILEKYNEEKKFLQKFEFEILYLITKSDEFYRNNILTLIEEINKSKTNPVDVFKKILSFAEADFSTEEKKVEFNDFLNSPAMQSFLNLFDDKNSCFSNSTSEKINIIYQPLQDIAKFLNQRINQSVQETTIPNYSLPTISSTMKKITNKEALPPKKRRKLIKKPKSSTIFQPTISSTMKKVTKESSPQIQTPPSHRKNRWH